MKNFYHYILLACLLVYVLLCVNRFEFQLPQMSFWEMNLRNFSHKSQLFLFQGRVVSDEWIKLVPFVHSL